MNNRRGLLMAFDASALVTPPGVANDLGLSEKQHMMRDSYRTFADNVVTSKRRSDYYGCQ